MRYSRSMNAALLLVGVCIFLTGCPDKKPKYPACKGDKDCKEAEHCVDKKCVQCRDKGDCAEGETCEANACVKKPGWCEADADCPDHKVCQNNQCVACKSDDECEGGRCSDGACLRPGECVKDEDCEDDEDCVGGRCQRLGLGDSPPPDIGCALGTIYFGFDTATITSDGRSALESNVDCMNKTDRTVYVIGHTDPRGTDEYNIALSDGRARAVADYMANLGIDPARFRIIPKGEADAVGTDDSTYIQDRRVDFEWK